MLCPEQRDWSLNGDEHERTADCSEFQQPVAAVTCGRHGDQTDDVGNSVLAHCEYLVG